MRKFLCRTDIIGAAFFALLFLTGCKETISIPVCMNDILTVAQTGRPIDVEIQIWVPIPSADECDKYTSKTLPAILVGFRTATAAGCETKGMDIFVKVKASSSVVRIDSAGLVPEIPDAMGIAIQPRTENGKNGDLVALTQMSKKMDAMISGAENEFSQKLSDLEVHIVFQNDSSGPVTIWTSGVFADGQPILETEKVEVVRRGSLDIILSDVAVAYFRKGNSIGIFNVEVPTP